MPTIGWGPVPTIGWGVYQVVCFDEANACQRRRRPHSCYRWRTLCMPVCVR